MPLNLQVGQLGSYSLEFDDAQGDVTSADPQAVLTWSITDPTIATLTPSADGKTCSVSPLKVGSATVQLNIPAVNAEPAIVGSDLLTTTAGEAVSVKLIGSITPPTPPTAPPAA